MSSSPRHRLGLVLVALISLTAACSSASHASPSGSGTSPSTTAPEGTGTSSPTTGQPANPAPTTARSGAATYTYTGAALKLTVSFPEGSTAATVGGTVGGTKVALRTDFASHAITIMGDIGSGVVNVRDTKGIACGGETGFGRDDNLQGSIGDETLSACPTRVSTATSVTETGSLGHNTVSVASTIDDQSGRITCHGVIDGGSFILDVSPSSYTGFIATASLGGARDLDASLMGQVRGSGAGVLAGFSVTGSISGSEDFVDAMLLVLAIAPIGL